MKKIIYLLILAIILLSIPCFSAGTAYKQHELPCTIECEDFDCESGVGYYDTTAGNLFGEYRTDEGVDITSGNDGYVVYISKGEWMNYTVNVPENGQYIIYLTASSYNFTGAKAKATLNNVMGEITLDKTSGSVFKSYLVLDTVLSKGENVIKLENSSSSNNTIVFDKLVVEKVQDKIYVDYESGNDENSGTMDAPLKTVVKAQELVRELNDDMSTDIYVYLKSGRHYIDDTIVFSEEDSATNGMRIIYTSYGDGTAEICGGVQITGWTGDSSTGIYSADISGDVDIRHLFVNGERAVRARSEGGLESVKSYDDTGIVTWDASILSFSHPEELEFVYYDAWKNYRSKVSSVSFSMLSGMTITMQQPTWSSIVANMTVKNANPAYYENALELLDTAGEFYFDKTASKVYYMPKSSELMSEADVVIPKLERILTIESTVSGEYVENIHFENIDFSYSAWNYPEEQGGFYSAQNNVVFNDISGVAVVDSAIWLERVKNVDFSNCTFSKLGGAGINLICGADGCDFSGNEFYDISGTALVVGDPNYTGDLEITENPALQTKNTTVSNNLFYNLPVEYEGGSMLTVGYPIGLTISNNEFSAAPYTAIHVGLGWNGVTTSNMRDVVIEKNYIHNILNKLYDGGAIYTNGGSGGSFDNMNIIRRNYITDINHSGNAIYHDEGTTWWYGTENVVDLKNSPFTLNHNYSLPERAYWIGYNSYGDELNTVYENNYTSTALTNLATSVLVKNTKVYENADFPPEALEIIREAGIKN